jgi:hypothetical protein
VQPDLEHGSSVLSISDTSQVIIRFKNNQQTTLYKESINRVIKSLNLNKRSKFREIPQPMVDIWASINKICIHMYDIQGA